MEAARVAAEDGYDVVLVEARTQLGGQLAVAARAHGRERWAAYLDWLEREIVRLGVSVRRETRVSAQHVMALAPDRVIIATGSVPGPPQASTGPVVDVDSYLAGDARVSTVAVVDSGAAGPALWMTALESARRGAEAVTVVTRLARAGADLDDATAQWLTSRFASLPIRVLPEHAVSELEGGAVVARSVWGSDNVELAADLVVVITRRVVVGDDLARDLGDLVPLSVIGDALLPRDVTAAVREGQRAGSASSNDGVARDDRRPAAVA
jgi:NADPH-dependent 2,4-dienoyl-CoA reductase/sulfur reductase-like enzyme